MKFAHEFKAALQREGFPPHWVDSAIPYGQLKKCLKKVQRELHALGLDPETLRQLLASHAAKYDLADGSSTLHPRLTVFVHLRDGEAVDATLTPGTRSFLRKLAADAGQSSPDGSPDSSRRPSLASTSTGSRRGSEDVTNHDTPLEQRVEVPLVFDAEFFDLLQSDVTSLDAIQAREEESVRHEITTLGEAMAPLTRPSSVSTPFHRKTDLSRWREVFELYLDAQVFFATTERECGKAKDSKHALERLVWFQEEVLRRGIVGRFKLEGSREAYTRFLELNARFLQSLKFQEWNRIAVTKILKKFDKRTSLGVSGAFPQAVRSRRFLASENVAKDLCAQVSTQIITTVPRLDDYSCPICLSISWLPIRLECNHVFCVRCMVKMQRQGKRSCPMCRHPDAVLTADLRNLDHELSRYLERYFKKETREKQRASDLERGVEMFGEGYKPSSCVVM